MASYYIYLQCCTCFLFISFLSAMNTENEVRIEILYRPSDCEVRSESGDLLVLHYIGINQENGKQFDSSLESGHPKQVRLGQHLAMLGWEQGLEDMCVGEKREVTIPPGPLQKGGISGSSMVPFDDTTVIYHFELLEIRDEAPRLRKFYVMDSNNDGHITMKEMIYYYIQKGTNDLTTKDAVRAVFSHQDINGDGIISKLEFIGKAHDEL
ncbi:uncharacterized protein [Antedon mediterranea]|uniref:uncharacterized protein n=1 Tax=Antedon mediterranea TaxID=105859 RepID=UPI003AF67CA8